MNGSRGNLEGNHNGYLVRETGDFGCDSGRARYFIKCNNCGKILHNNTTGPDCRIEQHEAEKLNVELTYFKESGKYYSEGEFKTCNKNLWEIWGEVKEMTIHPGLCGRWLGFILVNVPLHEHAHPKLIVP